jgi:uncharacterized protein (DUF302 family)
MLRILVVTATMVVAMAVTGAASAQELVITESAADFATTVQRLQAEIEERGATIVATVDHAAAAEANGLELRPTTVIIFGNPMLGTPLMQGQQTAGIDLPLRILVWEDADAKVQIGYWPPSNLADAHGIEDSGDVTDRMAAALDAISTEAAAP